MKKILLTTVAIVGMISSSSYAAQSTSQNVAAQTPTKAKDYQATTTASSDDNPSWPNCMPDMQGGTMRPGMMGGGSGMMGPGMMGGGSGMMGPGMMGGGSGMMGPGMMGGGSGMMGPGMMGGGSGMMGPGMMGGGSGMMGPGMMRGSTGRMSSGMMGLGYYMRGQENWTAEQQQQFLDDTTDLRRELVLKRFEISEAMRHTNTTPEQLGNLEKELIDIRTGLQKRALEISKANVKE